MGAAGPLAADWPEPRAMPDPASAEAGGVGTLLLGLSLEATWLLLEPFQGLREKLPAAGAAELAVDFDDQGDHPQPPPPPLAQPVVATGRASSIKDAANFLNAILLDMKSPFP